MAEVLQSTIRFGAIVITTAPLSSRRAGTDEFARAQQRAEVLKLIAANFEALQKGRDDLAREVGEALTKVEENPGDAAAWDDIRKVE